MVRNGRNSSKRDLLSGHNDVGARITHSTVFVTLKIELKCTLHLKELHNIRKPIQYVFKNRKFTSAGDELKQ